MQINTLCTYCTYVYKQCSAMISGYINKANKDFFLFTEDKKMLKANKSKERKFIKVTFL